MRKRKTRILIFCVILLPIVAFVIDYALAIFNVRPIFVVRTGIYKDGGTSVYRGWAYKVIDYNQLGNGRKDVVFISKIITKGSSNEGSKP